MSTVDLQDFLKAPPKSQSSADTAAANLAQVQTALRKLETAVIPEGVQLVSDLSEAFDGFVARVSLIGQVKAGKTALANGLLGTNGLLPSDVNPWTSVVTSMHVNVDHPKGKRAIFRFFSEEDWASMVDNGGRIAEIARKAKFDTKLNELTEQIKDMKRRTETRLGRNFNMLLGNQHSFSAYDTDLIKRYVCLGEEDLLTEKEGRFADLTKSADLYMDHDDFAYPITLADTPGVNDPFLIREAATLDNLGTSHICIVVLSAHQALSTVDIGLMRMLASLQNQRIIVFVNRIDELADPDTEIMEINTYVAQMLKKQNLPDDIPVIFGSAIWAEAALAGSMTELPEDSLVALQKLVTARTARLSENAKDDQNIDNLVDVTGITALRSALDHEVTAHVIAPFLDDLCTKATQIGEQSAVYLRQSQQNADHSIDVAATHDAIAFITKARDTLPKHIAKQQSVLSEQLRFGIAGAYRDFIVAEQKSLERHLAQNAPLDDWAPDTPALRAQLNTVYREFADRAQSYFDGLGEELTKALKKKYATVLDKDAPDINITGPAFGAPATPISLMRTLTIDFSSGIISGWFKRKLNKQAYLKEFEELALADMRDTLSEMEQENVSAYCRNSNRALAQFLAAHMTTLKQLSELTDDERRAELQKQLGLESEVETRLANIAAAVDALTFNRNDGTAISQTDTPQLQDVSK